MYTKRNQGQNKDKTYIFAGDENALTQKNNRTIIDFDYNSNNM